MPILAWASFVAFLIFMGLAAYAFHQDPRGRANRVFCVLAGALALWSLGFAFMMASTTVAGAVFWDRVASPGWFFAAAIMYHFSLVLSQPRRRICLWQLALIYLPAVCGLGWEILGRPFVDVQLRPSNFGWIHDIRGSKFGFSIFIGYYFVMFSGSLATVFRWRKNARLARERAQATLILATGIPAFAIGAFVDAILPVVLGVRVFPVISHLAAVIFAIGIWHGMVVHRMMTLTPEVAARDLVNAIRDVVLLIDAHGFVVSANRTFLQMIGIEETDVAGRRLADLDFMPPIDIHAETTELGGGFEGVAIERSWHATEGEPIPLSLNLTRVQARDGDLLGFLIVGWDQRAELRLASAHAEHRRSLEILGTEKELRHVMLQAVGEAVIVTDVAGRISLINPNAVALTGWSLEEATGRDVSEVVGLLDERTRLPLGNVARDVVRKTLEASVHGQGMDSGSMARTALMKDRSGRELSVQATVRPLSDEKGFVFGAMLLLRDLSENRRLMADLERAERLDALGFMAGGIAHDFNNILTAVFGNLELARLVEGSPPENVQMLSEAEKALARARKLTDRLMTVVRGESLPSMQVVDLRSVFEETGRMMTRRPNLEMKFRWSSEPMKVMGDEGLLNQVAANLLVNAVQAVPKDRGMISIDGEVVANRGGDPGMPAGMAKGMWMRIKVQDNGPGISPDAASKIFDPFFTTKDKGTGLGLAMVRRIVEVHGGKVSAQSIPNFGTTFVLWLPSIVDDAASRRSEQTESP